MANSIAEIFDVFFNGRPANGSPRNETAITLQQLIKRGTSHIRVGKKTYRVEITEVTLRAEPKAK